MLSSDVLSLCTTVTEILTTSASMSCMKMGSENYYFDNEAERV